MIFVLTFVFLTWAYCFFCGHVSDDNDKFERMPKETWKKALTNTSFVHDIINMILWKVFKKKHWGWFLFSISIHLLNVYLLYMVCLVYFAPEVALIASLVFGVHTVNHQGVAWISGAGYSLCGTFCLLCVLYGGNYFVFFGLWVLALSSFLGACSMPIVMAFIKSDPSYLWFLTLGLFFLLYKFKTRFKLLQARSRYFMPYPARLNMLIKVFMYYAFMCLIPVKMGWYHEVGFDYDPRMDKTDARTLWSLLGTCLLFWTAVHYGVLIPLLWFLFLLLPSMNIVFCNSFVAERYAYVPMLGFSVLIGGILSALPFTAYTVSFYVGFLFVHTLQVQRSYKSNLALYRYNVWKHPKSTYAINNLGFFYLAKHKPFIAINYFREAIKIEPNNKFAWQSLGTCYALLNTEVMAICPNCQNNFKSVDAGNFWKSIMGMNQSIKISPNWDVPHNNIRQIIEHMKRCGILLEDKQEGEHGQSHSIFSNPMPKGTEKKD